MRTVIEQRRLWWPAVCWLAPVLLLGAVTTPQAAAQLSVRVKDLTEVEGVRSEKLMGIGLVTGLNGTGGKNPTTRIYVMNMLQRFGTRADPIMRSLVRDDAKEKTDNVSVVTVTAELPRSAHRGSVIQRVHVATADDASSLQNGILIQTPLTGYDDQVYAVADGPVSIGGGYSVGGQAASAQKNHPTAGTVISGATVVKELCPPPLGANGWVRLLLRQADFENTRRIVQAVNEAIPGVACILDEGTVALRIPPEHQADPNSFVALVGLLQVTPDVKAKVVINEKTGTVVIGDNVRLSRVAVTHANLAVVTGESPMVSQPAPFSQGETTVVPRTQLDVLEEHKALNVLEDAATVGDLVRALNALGVTPRDLSAIFQQLQAVGALHAELEFN
jgi:flagellar P-ring protein precursor FlgI